MALDHYIPQVHLKKFNASVLGDRMYALRKADLKGFRPSTKDVCRVEAGSTNAYLRDDRVIEEFLKTVEPKYTASVEKLAAGAVDNEAIYTIAGFVAYVNLCSPAATRIKTVPLKRTLESTARLMDAAGKFSAPPQSLGGDSLTELLAHGHIKFEVDPKYPQAIGIAGILDATKMYGNFSWEILLNDFEDSPFFSSDFPVAIECSDDVRVLNRLIPLTPNLALRIYPDVNVRREDCDFSFSKFRYRIRLASRKDVIYLNTAFVRCAETTVFYCKDLPWIQRFVERNRQYRIEPRVDEIPNGTGTILISTQTVVAAGL